jgi:hypothetical protein
MVVTRAGGYAVEGQDIERLQAEELARAMAAAQRLEADRLQAALGRTQEERSQGSGSGVSEATLGALLNLVSSQQVEMTELRRTQRQAPDDGSDEDPDRRDGDHGYSGVPDQTRVMSPAELSMLTHSDLVPAECHDPRFSASLDYRYYRLLKRSDHYSSQTASCVARWTR